MNRARCQKNHNKSLDDVKGITLEAESQDIGIDAASHELKGATGRATRQVVNKVFISSKQRRINYEVQMVCSGNYDVCFR